MNHRHSSPHPTGVAPCQCDCSLVGPDLRAGRSAEAERSLVLSAYGGAGRRGRETPPYIQPRSVP
jgi:hypothetical protein